jgi:DNA-directed RNA polymerase subunit beta
VFPITDFTGQAMLEFVRYEFEMPKYDVEECQQRGMTYAAPLKVTLRLIVFEIDQDTGAKSVKDIKEQDVYMGDIPLMTSNGTFVVNGTERVIVSQMHRSPGVFFDHDRGKTHSSGKLLFAARIIPYRGSWLDFEFDAKDIIHVRIDRRRKVPVTTLLYALGLDSEEILHRFYKTVPYTRTEDGWRTPFNPERYRGLKPAADLVNADTKEVAVDAGKKITPRLARKLADEGLKELLVRDEDLFGHYVADELVNDGTGEIYAEAGDELDAAALERLREAGIDSLNLLDIDHINTGAYIRNTLKADKAERYDQALLEIYRVMRPGEPPTKETAEVLFRGLFFDAERYDLSAVGRVKMNMRLDLDAPDTERTLRKEDILAVIETLAGLRDGKGEIDDIDHLGNRRVRSVGELMENQYRLGLVRMERAIKERMSSVDIDTVMPHDLINAKPAAAAVREFFGSSQLSQFMDQTNPLSEITHKRRLSALGPGGLTRERAGFEVRDVHPTHYGRICPIETPEGPNIGLINSLATYARVNKYGFIETPYRKVIKGKVSKEVVYLSAIEEGKHHIAQANVVLNKDATFADEMVNCRHQGNALLTSGRQRRFRRRVAQAARVGGRRPHPVPRERRRQPGAHGLQHAAPGRAAHPQPGAARRHRHGAGGGARFRCRDHRPARRHGRPGRCQAHRHPGDQGNRPDEVRRRHLHAVQVPALEPEHLHQPAPAGACRRPGGGRRHHRRRSLDRPRRPGAGPERAGRLHAVERLQLRGLHPPVGAHGA